MKTKIPADEVLGRFGEVRRQINLIATKELMGSGIGPKQLVFLRFIAKHGRVCLSQLSRGTFSDPAAVGRAVDTLVNQGWLIRAQHPEDRRKWLLTLTPKGKTRMSDVNRAYKSISQKMARSLSDEERKVFLSMLGKIYFDLDRHLAAKTARV